MSELLKQDILAKIREIAATSGGQAPGRSKFFAETGIKPHEWRGRIWRNWSDAIAEAGFAPNERQAAFEDDELLAVVCAIAKDLKRFPSTSDIEYDARRNPNAPSGKTREHEDLWGMPKQSMPSSLNFDGIGGCEERKTGCKDNSRRSGSLGG